MPKWGLKEEMAKNCKGKEGKRKGKKWEKEKGLCRCGNACNLTVYIYIYIYA